MRIRGVNAAFWPSGGAVMRVALTLSLAAGHMPVDAGRTRVVVAVSAKSLDTAIFRYQTGDRSTQVRDLLLRATSPPSAAEVRRKALFYLGRFDEREYELSRRSASLESAYGYYNAYSVKYGRAAKDNLISDALFYKALCLLQMPSTANRTNAVETAQRINPQQDDAIYIDQIVWTADRSYAVNATVRSGDLRDALVSSLKKHMDYKFSDVYVDEVLLDLKQGGAGKRAGSRS